MVWEKDIAEDEHAGSLARILHHNGLVYIGLQSVEEPLTKMKKNFEVNFRGKVMALNAKTGELVWESWLVEPPHNGVPVWSSFSVDPVTNTLFFTTGNNYTGEPMWSVPVGYGHVGGGIHAEASVGLDRILIWGNNA